MIESNPSLLISSPLLGHIVGSLSCWFLTIQSCSYGLAKPLIAYRESCWWLWSSFKCSLGSVCSPLGLPVEMMEWTFKMYYWQAHQKKHSFPSLTGLKPTTVSPYGNRRQRASIAASDNLWFNMGRLGRQERGNTLVWSFFYHPDVYWQILDNSSRQHRLSSFQ